MHGQARDSVAKALKIAAQEREQSIEALRTLVRIPSLTGEEGEAQAHLAAKLKGMGAEVSVMEPDLEAMFERFPKVAQYPTHWQHDLILPYTHLPTYKALKESGRQSVLNYHRRPNVVGVFPGTGGGRSLILNGHIDTVTVEPRHEWTRDPFGAEVEDGRMYGRGISDMKGGLLAGLLAVDYLRKAGVALRGDVIFQSVVNEEHAGNGTLDLVVRGYKADAAIVLEPTNNQVSVSHPGGLYWVVTVPGESRATGARWEGRVQKGVSAIEKLPPVITALLGIESHFNADPVDDPLEDGRAPFSLVIGKVLGGHYETVTASEVVLRGGAYFAPMTGEVHEVMARFQKAIAEANRADDFLRHHPARLEFLHHDDSTRQSPQIPLAVHMGEVLARRGGDAKPKPAPGACDMRHLVNQGGIPSIIFGPGSVTQIHKPNEHILLQEYLECIEHLIEFIPEWCNQDREK
jgi:acetylornithine deacetylase